MTTTGAHEAAAPRGDRSRSTTRPRAVTLDDVARLAGVSRITASRVVGGSTKVSPLTRRAVEEAAAALGYVPNRAARALVTGRTDSVGLVLSRTVSDVFSHPFFADVTRELNRQLADEDVQLLLLVAETQRDRERISRYARGGHVDGFLVFQGHDENPLPELLKRFDVPLVLGSRLMRADLDVSYVDFDNDRAGHEAATFLLERGHRRIACIAGPQHHSAGVDRLAGFRRALSTAGCLDDRLVTETTYSVDSGESGLRAVLDAAPDITAAVACSDLLTIGALRELRRAGRRTPEDVEVVGFSDSDLLTEVEPDVSMVRQDLSVMASEMIRLLRAQTDGLRPPTSHVLLPARLRPGRARDEAQPR